MTDARSAGYGGYPPQPFVPTHSAPAGGLSAWGSPDGRAPAVATIEARVEMRILQLYGDWAQIECNNGWTAWVDARRLTTGPPPTPTPTAMPMQLPMAVPVPSPVPSYPAPPQPRGSVLGQPLIRLGRYAVTLRELVPAVGLALGALLPWLRGDIGSGSSLDVPLLFLIGTQPGATAIKIGYLLIAAALVGFLVPQAPVRLAAFALALAVCVLYVIQLQRALSEADSTSGVGSFIGYGVYVTAVAAVLGCFWCIRPGRP